MTAKPNIPLPERELWLAFKSGDERAFAEIFHTYYHDLYFYGLKFSADEELVKDGIQDLFTDIWSKKERLGEVQHIKSYLIKSLRRLLIRRKKVGYKKLEEAQKFVDTTASFELSTEDLLIHQEAHNEQLQQLESVFKHLNKTQKEIIYLKFYSDLDYKEIAEIMSIRYQSVRNSMHRAISKLREAFYISEKK